MKQIYFKDLFFLYHYKGGYDMCLYDDLIMIECIKPYVKICMKERSVLLQMSLCSVESMFPSAFYKVNRNIVVNIKYVVSVIHENNGYWIRLNTNTLYKVSRNRYQNLLRLLCK